MSSPVSSDVSITSKEDGLSEAEQLPTEHTPEKRVFYRTTFFAATILGLCNFAAPGIWGESMVARRAFPGTMVNQWLLPFPL